MSNPPKSLNDTAWEHLFAKYDILNRVDAQGLFEISAAQIKEFREPRLMAKFDHTINLPKIFSDNKLAILPITRGDYVISHFRACLISSFWWIFERVFRQARKRTRGIIKEIMQVGADEAWRKTRRKDTGMEILNRLLTRTIYLNLPMTL